MAEYIDFSYVKSHADFEPVLAYYGIETEGRGDEQSALCPFHDERKPSFKVNLDKKAFNCFGCGVHGNVLEFVQQMSSSIPSIHTCKSAVLIRKRSSTLKSGSVAVG